MGNERRRAGKPGKIVILGAGLSGLTCAYYLKRDYTIFEKESRAGGLCRSEKINKFIFDYTGHLLHMKRKENKELIKKLLGKNLFLQKRKAWVYSKKTYTKYPFQANLYGLPAEVIKECVEGFIEARSQAPNRSYPSPDFKTWIYDNFGRGHARHFMIPYNEKLWTVPLEEMSAEWTKKFVPVPTIEEVQSGAQGRQGKDFGYNIRFYYPLRGGIEELISSFGPFTRRVTLHSKAAKIFLTSKKIRFANSGEEIKYDTLVSTIPLPELVKISDCSPDKIKKASRRLDYVSVFNLNLGVQGGSISDKHWIYFPEKDFSFYRVGFASNFSSALAPKGTSAIYTEVSYSKTKPIDKKSIREKIIRDLMKAKILQARHKILAERALDIKYAYPLYGGNHREDVALIQRFLKGHNVYSVGRFGSWEYFSMEDVIEQGRKLARYLNRRPIQ
jgi:UDP-galactopyranose mutase